MCEIKYNIRKHSLGVGMATVGTRMGRHCMVMAASLAWPPGQAQKAHCRLSTQAQRSASSGASARPSAAPSSSLLSAFFLLLWVAVFPGG